MSREAHVEPLRPDRRHDVRRLGDQRRPRPVEPRRRSARRSARAAAGSRAGARRARRRRAAFSAASNAPSGIAASAAARGPASIQTTAERCAPSRSGSGTSVNGPPERWISVETPAVRQRVASR